MGRSSISSDENTAVIKESISGILELPFTSSDTSASVTFDHNLNLVPVTKVYQIDPNAPTAQLRIPWLAPSTVAGPSLGTIDFKIDFYLTQTQLVVTAEFFKGLTFGENSSYLLSFVMFTP